MEPNCPVAQVNKRPIATHLIAIAVDDCLAGVSLRAGRAVFMPLAHTVGHALAALAEASLRP